MLESSGKVAYVDMEVPIHKTMQAAANKFSFWIWLRLAVEFLEMIG